MAGDPSAVVGSLGWRIARDPIADAGAVRAAGTEIDPIDDQAGCLALARNVMTSCT